MIQKEPINIRTEGRVIFRDKNNQIYKVVKIRNLITTAGRQWVLEGLIGTSTDIYDSLELGDSATTPTLTDTGVTNLVETLPITIVDDTANSKFTITAVIPQAAHIGQVFREAAIKLDDGTCFNHSTFPDFTKSTPQVDVEWDIIYS